MTRIRVIREMSADLPCRGRVWHMEQVRSEVEPGHSRCKLDLAKRGRICMEGEGMLYSRTSMSKNDEAGSQWVFHLVTGEGVWGRGWKWA